MNQEILRAIQSSPEAQQALGVAIQEILQDSDITPENIDEIVRMFEFVLQNPDSYAEFRQSAIQSGAMDEEDLPMQFDEAMLTVVLMALKVVQEQMQAGNVPRFARGGLNQIARMGRNGDTMLAHINPFEARILKSYGGSGGVNPYTGQVEYRLGRRLRRAFKKIVKAVAPVLPIALAFIPGGAALAGTLGSALSGGALAGTAANMLGSAAISGLSSAASGGDFLKGAVGGALGAGVAPVIGGAVGDTLGMALGDTAKNVVGSAITGGAQSALTGGDFASGALQGALGGYAGSTLSGAAANIDGRLGTGLQAAGQQFGNALTMGATPQEALGQSAIAGLTAGMLAPTPKSPYDITPEDTGGLGLKKPSDLVVEGLKAPALNTASVPEMGLGMNYGVTGGMTPTFKGPETMSVDYSLFAPSTQTTSAQPDLGTGIQASPLNVIAAQTAATTPGVKGTVGDAPANKGFSIGSAANMLPLLSLFNSAETPEQIQQVVSKMTPEQQEYFNRPMRTWNWDTLSAAAKIQGLPIGSYIARNWDKVGGGMYDNPVSQESNFYKGGFVQKYSLGGRVQKTMLDLLDKRKNAGLEISENGWVDLGTGAVVDEEKIQQYIQDPLRLALYSGSQPQKQVQNPNYDWNKIQQLADQSGLGVGQYIARNWGQVMPTIEAPVAKARGGALTRLARGGGSGRDDTIPARLSDGEYVMDAETVALLGDGSTDAGARQLDRMRAKIREHKGKSMARGKFSANAKSPLAYLKESA